MPVTGSLDTVESGRIVGWAWDPERPRGAAEVFLWIDGRLVDRALANRLRGDLARAGIADSRHGFAFACSIPAGTREIRVTTAAGADLPRSPWRPQQPGPVPIPPDHDRITILAIARNEEPYIEEWIAHHRAIGVDRFLIYDNASTDGTAERLRANPAIAGLVEVVDWPSSRHLPTEGPQLPAYADALPTLKQRGGWVAVIDIDEFIVPLADHSLPALLARFRDVPALSLCRKTFGSSGHSDRDDDRLVTDRFRFAGPSALVKTIVRPAAVSTFEFHAHRMETGLAVDELRRPIAQRSISPTPTYRWGQINRYSSRSWTEYEAKRSRSRADKAARSEVRRQPAGHVHGMDSGSQYEVAIHRFQRGMLRTLTELFPERAERAAVARRVRSRQAHARAAAPLVPSPARLWRHAAQPSAGKARGAIDLPTRSTEPIPAPPETPLRVAGWLLDPVGTRDRLRVIFLRPVDGCAASAYVAVLPDGRRRPDVERLFPHLPESAIANCGFDASINIRSLARGTYRLDLGILSDAGAALVSASRLIRIG